jgi:hypothetical protein
MPIANLAHGVGRILKDRFEGDPVVQFSEKRYLLSNVIKRKPLRRTGNNFYMGLTVRGNESATFIGEEDPLPAAQKALLDQINIPARYLAASFKVTEVELESTKDKAGAFISEKLLQMRHIRDSSMRIANEAHFRDSSGALARVDMGVPALANLTLDGEPEASGDDTYGARYMREDMRLEAWSAKTGGAKRGDFVGVVANIDTRRSATQDQIDANGTGSALGSLANNDYIFKEGERGNSIDGLPILVDDGTRQASYLGIDATAAGNRFWQSDRQSAGGPISENLMQQVIDQIETEEDGSIDVILTDYDPRRYYFNKLVGDRRFMVNIGSMSKGGGANYKGGFQALAYCGGSERQIPIVVDRDCNLQTMYFLDTSHIFHVELKPAGILNTDGSVLRWIQNYMAWMVVWVWFFGLATDKRNAHGKIINITS